MIYIERANGLVTVQSDSVAVSESTDITGDGEYNIDLYVNSTSASNIVEIFVKEAANYHRLMIVTGSAVISERRGFIHGLKCEGIRITTSLIGDSVKYNVSQITYP